MSSQTALGRARGSLDPAEAIVVVVRLGVLALCALLTLLSERAVPRAPLLLLTVIALVMSIPMPSTRVTRLRPLLEALLVAGVIGFTTPLPEPLLPYLVVPPLAAGLLSGVIASTAATVISLLVLVVARGRTGDLSDPKAVTLIAEWIGLGLATGLVGAWARSVATRETQANSTYVAAHRLLTRLRDVARALPTGLDEVALAQQVLTSMREDLGFDRGALYGRAEGGVLMPLAYAGADHVEWVPSSEEGIWGKVWRSGQVVQQTGTFSDPQHGHSAVLALRLGDRRVGLIGVERDGGPWSARHLARAQSLADDAALRIDTGQLFSEVRALATVEERRRLAREIHDGIAQEVASLGYVVDDLSAHTSDPQTREDLGTLRTELTRIVNELRLSIFDLRTRRAAGLRARCGAHQLRPVGRHRRRSHRAPRPRRVAVPPADRGRDRAAARGAGGDHQRPQARPRAQPLGDLPGRPAACVPAGGRRRQGPRVRAAGLVRPRDHARAHRPPRRGLHRPQPRGRRDGRRGHRRSTDGTAVRVHPVDLGPRRSRSLIATRACGAWHDHREFNRRTRAPRAP